MPKLIVDGREIEVPAEYKSVKKRIVKTPAETRTEKVPAVYKIVKKQVMVEAPKTRTVTVPAEYKTEVVNELVEGAKDIMVNSERQKVIVRGMIRWADLSPSNRVASDRLAGLEIQIQGKGVVQDAIRRPNILYRILLGILPF